MELGAREEQAGRRKEARERGDDGCLDTQFRGERCRVDGTRATVGEQDEIAGVTSLLGRDCAERPHHGGVRQLVDTPGHLERGEGERFCQQPDRSIGLLLGDGEIARGQRARWDVTEGDVGIGDGWLQPAEAVAGRPGKRTGAAWPNLETPGGIEPREAASARADLGDVDRRDANELAAAPQESAPGRERGADLVLLAARDAAVLDQRGLGRRPAHVERDHVPVAEPLGEPERGDDTGGGARLEREDGPRDRVGGGHHAARRLHDHQRSRVPRLSSPLRMSPT